MVLSDIDLKKAMVSGKLFISNLHKNSIQPSSIDLHLGDEFVQFTSKRTVDIYDVESGYDALSIMDSIKIPSRAFILATTEEAVELSSDLVGFIEGRSSIGRKGLFIHNAGFIDCGFKGKITLELFNASPRPIVIHRGMPICQMVVMETISPAQNPYNGKYQKQNTVTVSRLYQDIFGGDKNVKVKS